MRGFFDELRQWFRGIDPLIRNLLWIFLGVYAVKLLVGPEFARQFALIPRSVIQERRVWQLFTWFFLHAGILHILFNFGLFWFFGAPVLAQWGRREFVKFLAVCGVGSALTVIALGPNSTAAVMGSSGAAYGLIVAFSMVHPEATLFLLFIPVRAAYLPGVILAFELLAGTALGSPGISRAAHIGGMITGWVYLRWWWLIKLRLSAALKEAASPEPDAPRRRSVPRRAPRPVVEPEPVDEMAEVDRILDKILDSGLESLTDEERGVMHRYSQRKKPS